MKTLLTALVLSLAAMLGGCGARADADMAAVEKMCLAAPTYGDPDPQPAAVLSVESILKPGVYFPVAIFFGYGDNVDRARDAGERLTTGLAFPQGFRVRLCSR
jgi:hypothetical protein